MKRGLGPIMSSLVIFTLAGAVQDARAYEYPLQFTPNAGYRDLVVAGYGFEGNDVVGNCSYRILPVRSGKGAGASALKFQNHDQTCRWDPHGNLLRVTPGAPTVPSPLRANGTMKVYAANANGSFTGTDSRIPGGGFVSTPGPHYSWLTPNGHSWIKQNVSSLVIILKSDDAVPLNITAVDASSLKGAASLENTNCIRTMKLGETCSIRIKYDPANLTSPTGLAYDTLRISLKSNAAVPRDFVQNFTIAVPKEPKEDDRD